MEDPRTGSIERNCRAVAASVMRLSRGADVMAMDVVSDAMNVGRAGTPDEVRHLVLKVVRFVAEHGLMQIGDMVVVGPPPTGLDIWVTGFAPTKLSVSEAMGAIERDWQARGRAPDIYEGFWVENTPLGAEIVDELLAVHKERTPAAEILVRGTEGSVDTDLLETLLFSYGGSEFRARTVEVYIKVVHELLAKGLAQIELPAVERYDATGAKAVQWVRPHASLPVILAWVETEWRKRLAGNRSLRVFQMRNTPLGDEAVRETMEKMERVWQMVL